MWLTLDQLWAGVGLPLAPLADFGQILGRLWFYFVRTLGDFKPVWDGLWADFRPALGQPWVNVWPTFGQLCLWTCGNLKQKLDRGVHFDNWYVDLGEPINAIVPFSRAGSWVVSEKIGRGFRFASPVYFFRFSIHPRITGNSNPRYGLLNLHSQPQDY